MARYCPNCGDPVPEENSYCSECGTALDEDGGGGTSGWDDAGNTGQNQGSGWDDAGNTGQNQGSGWDGTQGTSQGRQRGPQQPGRGAQTGSGLPRKNAVDTVSQALNWLTGLPVLIGGFLVLGLINSLGQIVTGLFSLVGFIISLILWGVAFKYAERLSFGEQVRGDIDEVTSMASEVTGQLLSLIGIAILYFLAVGLGFVLLVAPGVYLAARLALAFPACVLDGQGAIDSLSTSWEVASGNVLKLVGIVLINLLAAFGISVIGGAVGGLALLQSPAFVLVTAPISAIIGATVQMAVARVYLENRGVGPQPQGQPAGGYQESTQY
jgi:hypothetical protein